MRPEPLQCGPYRLAFDRTLIMGVLNVTPDSFSDGGRFLAPEAAIEQGRRMAAEGADLLDIGGESTRPGADEISEKEELRRIGPVLEALSKQVKVPLSVDTRKPRVAAEAVRLGACLINDVSGLRDPAMVRTAAEAQVPAVIMHMRGTPKTMQEQVYYEDVVLEIKNYLRERAETALAAGVPGVIVDPGIGFGKNLDHNLELLRRLGEFGSLGCPVLVGVSRKSFLGRITEKPVNERGAASVAAAVGAIMYGAHIVRVHDVAESKTAARVADAILGREAVKTESS